MGKSNEAIILKSEKKLLYKAHNSLEAFWRCQENNY